MTHRSHVVAVLMGTLVAATWASGPAWSRPASHTVRHGVVIDSTDYQSEQQLLANTQVMVVATVESVRTDRAAPTSQPASLVALRVKDVIRGHPGKQVVVEQPRGAKTPNGQVGQAPLQKARTYLLLLAREPDTRSYFLVGGDAGEFAYNTTTQKFTKLDASATWEQSGFGLSVAKIGANVFPESSQPSWLTSPGTPGPAAISWSSMTNDLGLSLTDVSCPSETVCVFAGSISPPTPGEQVPAVAMSTGPFTAQSSIVGTTTTFPPSSNPLWSFVACPSPTLCVLSSVDGVYVTTDPAAAHWTLEVAPSSDYGFGQVSCPTVSFCAVVTGSGVLVSGSPSTGPSAWSYIGLGQNGLQYIACPTPELCVAGGSGDVTVGGWIETSTDPLAPATWHGGATTHPSFAQHSGQYSVSGISCPTTAFCIAAVDGGQPLVSTNPAGGVATWSAVANGARDLGGAESPGFAACTTTGQCSVSGVGSFRAGAGAPGPGVVGYPPTGVSCVSTSFCVTTADNQLAVGKATG
jgi:hypothetical protein